MRVVSLLAALCWLAAGHASAQAITPDSTWEELARHPIPQWFADAKFGIYAHWGVYSVPAYGNEWYPRMMYQEGSDTYRHHAEAWGEPSVFGYKDFIPLFTAERFDADEWADLYARAGARFAGPVAEHHDGFSMWASKVNRWNAAAMGPRRDVARELSEAVRARGLKVIASLHHGFNIQGYYATKPGWDTADPAYADLYGQFADRELAYQRWLTKCQEMIDACQPDQVWFDFCLGPVPSETKRQMASYYYAKETEWGRPVIIARKGQDLPEGVGVLDIERGKMDAPAPQVWQTDDSVAINSWSWVEGLQLKTAEELLHELIDIVSKNGVLLLNIAPKADGSIPEDQRGLLLEMGDWLRIQGEAIYATRPWSIHGEGPHLFDAGRGFGGEQVRFTAQDIRYTRTDAALYAIALGWPEEGEIVLESLDASQPAADARVTLVGVPGPVEWRVDESGRLHVTLPAFPERERPVRHACALKLEGFGFGASEWAAFQSRAASRLTPEAAVVEGSQAKLEKRGERSCIGYWDRADESLHWLLHAPRAGRYLVEGDFAAAAGSTALTLSAEEESVAFVVPSTASWDEPARVRIGSLALPHPGVYHVVLRPADAAGWRAINVFEIRIAPAP